MFIDYDISYNCVCEIWKTVDDNYIQLIDKLKKKLLKIKKEEHKNKTYCVIIEDFNQSFLTKQKIINKFFNEGLNINIIFMEDLLPKNISIKTENLDENKKLKIEYDMLKNVYNNLQTQYNALEEKYKNLQKDHEKIIEKVKQIIL